MRDKTHLEITIDVWNLHKRIQLPQKLEEESMSCQRFYFKAWGPPGAIIWEEKQTVFLDLHRQLSDHVNTLKVHSYQDQSEIRLLQQPPQISQSLTFVQWTRTEIAWTQFREGTHKILTSVASFHPLGKGSSAWLQARERMCSRLSSVLLIRGLPPLIIGNHRRTTVGYQRKDLSHGPKDWCGLFKCVQPRNSLERPSLLFHVWVI